MKNIKDFYGMNLNNVTFLNEKARLYHATLYNAHNDLQLVYCEDLWVQPRVMTKEALKALRLRIKGKYYLTTVPIAPEIAAQLVDEVIVESDIDEILV